MHRNWDLKWLNHLWELRNTRKCICIRWGSRKSKSKSKCNSKCKSSNSAKGRDFHVSPFSSSALFLHTFFQKQKQKQKRCEGWQGFRRFALFILRSVSSHFFLETETLRQAQGGQCEGWKGFRGFALFILRSVSSHFF